MWLLMVAAALVTTGIIMTSGSRSISSARILMTADGPYAEDKVKKWVKPGDWQKHVTIDTHGRTTGYRASPGEMYWLSELQKGKICATSNLPHMTHESRLWLNYSVRAWLPEGRPAPIPSTEEKAALSYFRAESMSPSGFMEPIEPLHGIARHPFAKVGCAPNPNNPHDVGKFNIEYIIVHNNCGSSLPKPKSFLFDMGASVGFHKVPGGLYKTMPTNGGLLAPSLPLFYRMYQDRCLEPDEIYAWEPHPKVSDKEFYGQVPAHIRAKMHFYKDFVDEGSLSEAEEPIGDPHHPVNSFLAILEAVVSPADFVAVKVDIDTPHAELMIIEAIAERPEIAALIDEIYFEYHFWFDGMNFGWANNVNGDVDSALGLMRRLRELGIRSHFWI